jgi:hypothetical protein
MKNVDNALDILTLQQAVKILRILRQEDINQPDRNQAAIRWLTEVIGFLKEKP